MVRRRRHARLDRFAYGLAAAVFCVLSHSHVLAQPVQEAGFLSELGRGVDDSGAALEGRGIDYLIGRGVRIDRDEARRLLESAANSGRPLASGALADLIWDDDDVSGNRESALALYATAAEHGYAWAQRRVGWAYLNGDGVPEDHAEAHRLLSAAADQEDAFALYFLGEMYGRGMGVERDVDYALELLARSAELGCVPAMRTLGASLFFGNPRRDLEMGQYLLERAALRDDAGSAFILGRSYLGGGDVDRDFALAERWLAHAADLEHRLAALWLAELYGKGLGVERDENRAASLRASALSAATASERNAFAWELSVAGDELLRNGALAVEMMEELLQDPGQRSWAYLDTLAAAHAESGQFEEAVATQRAAIAALPPSSSEERTRDLSERLELYRVGEPYRP